MVEARWFRRAGSGIAVVALSVAGATATAGAPPPPWDPPSCEASPARGPGADGAWFRLDPTLAAGVRVGQRLTLGTAADGAPKQVDLDAESFASGPDHGSVLVGTDDGTTSSLSIIDLTRGCRSPVARSTDVIRHAVLTPEGDAIVEFRVDRRTRRDLGVWRRPLGTGEPTAIIGPIEPDDRFGPTWLTTLDWADDERTLVIESCGEVACRYRLVDRTTRATRLVADPSLGSLVGVATDRLVVRGACRGLPCPVLSVRPHDGRTVTLHAAAGQAVLGRDATGAMVVVHEIDADAGAVRAVALDGRHLGPVDVPAGQRLVGAAAWSGGSIETADDSVVFAPDGRLPIDGRGMTVALGEDIR
jgi:hypothetical protein